MSSAQAADRCKHLCKHLCKARKTASSPLRTRLSGARGPAPGGRLTTAPQALPSLVLPAPPTRLYCPGKEAPEAKRHRVSPHRCRPNGSVDFPCQEPNQSSGLRFPAKVKQKIWNPSACSVDGGARLGDGPCGRAAGLGVWPGTCPALATPCPECRVGELGGLRAMGKPGTQDDKGGPSAGGRSSRRCSGRVGPVAARSGTPRRDPALPQVQGQRGPEQKCLWAPGTHGLL